MRAIISTIEKRNIGIFESPTGTGKSMSIICSLLHWLQKEEKRIINDVMSQSSVQVKDKKVSTVVKTQATSVTGIDWLDDIITSNGEEEETKRLQRDALAVRDILHKRIRIKNSLAPIPLHNKRRVVMEKEDRIDTLLKQCNANANEISDTDLPDDDILCDYESDDEADKFNNKKAKVDVAYESVGQTQVKEFFCHPEDIPLNDQSGVDWGLLSTEVEMHLPMPKIFYCSRTHSQLAQFVSEVKKATSGDPREVRCITLGSRSAMCINPSVRKLSTDAAISEKCLDLQTQKVDKSAKVEHENNSIDKNEKRKRRSMQTSTPSRNIKHKCEFHKPAAELHFAEHAMGAVRDIEDLVSLGESVQGCPYYASRKALPYAQLICLPYNLMLSRESRSALGVCLKNNIVIFDEAHNIVESANMTHSAEVNDDHLLITLLTLKAYLSRFRNVLNGKNFYYLNLLISIVKSFLKLIEKTETAPNISDHGSISCNGKKVATSVVYTVNDFVFLTAVDNVNLHKVSRYVSQTHLVRKVGGFVDNEIKKAKNYSESYQTSKKRRDKDQANSFSKSNSHVDSRLLSTADVTPTLALRNFFSLLTALQNADADGRIFIATNKNSGDSAVHNISLRYALLNPSNHFSDIVEDSRSVIFIGGTLQPFEFITSSLLPRFDIDVKMSKQPMADKTVDTFSCAHIVPSSHISTYVIQAGPSNVSFDFRHGNRDKTSLVYELFWSVYNICQTVPHGVVLFFTSYAYMDYVVETWRKAILTPQLAAIKHICIEKRKSSPRDGKARHEPPEDTWDNYSSLVKKSTTDPTLKGSILLSVMGGRLSEGINFSDDLARAVVIVGMPYPDLKDPILKEKLKFAEASRKGSSRRIYEGMCMKVVNQSIGRAIRHINDYSTVFLLDHRYAQKHIKSQLPNWILKSSSNDREIFHMFSNFHDSLANARCFFASK